MITVPGMLLLMLLSPPSARVELESLSWISGEWASSDGGARSEELWTTPAGGVMLGLHRDVRPSGRAFFEYLRIEERDGTLFYVAAPGGTASTEFELDSSGDSRVSFVNELHDWPKRITYWRDGQRLCARASGLSSSEQSQEWCWDRR